MPGQAGRGNQVRRRFVLPAHNMERAMQVPHDSVILVADGRKSLFFRNEGDAEYPNLIVEEKEVHPNPAHHEQASDLAGQSARTVDGRGGSMEEVDFHQLEEDRFAAETAAMLKERALRNDYDALVVVAPPRTLGALRKHYHKEVEKRLVAELPKDLVNLTVPEIEKLLQNS
jgi:protein required for attachment to host cells